MSKKRRQISEKLKSKIVEQSYSKEYRTKDLARKYGISIGSIYVWRKAAQNNVESFVELEIPKSGILDSDQGLQQIESIYNNYSLSIKGKIDQALILKYLSIYG